MNNYENEIKLLRCYYYSTDLPIQLKENGKLIFSMPENTVTAADIGENEDLSLLTPEKDKSSQYFQTAAGESFIILQLNESALILIGPFLINKPSESFVADMARSGMIRLHCKNDILNYYDNLPLISGQKFFYAGQLLESVFLSDNVRSSLSSDSESSLNFIPQDYYTQAKNYRSLQFRHSPYIVEQEICHMISNGDMAGAHRILNEINSRPRAKLAGSAIRSLKNSVICSCSFMTRAAISGGVSPDVAFTLSDTYIQLVENCTDINSILKYENEMVDGFTSAVKNAKKDRHSHVVTQALSYIDDHLCEPISIKNIADELYLSPNYLSAIFTRETGQTIHNYIIKRRIDEAAFLLRSSMDPVADISSFYQFCSQSHFVQCFKRIKGVTPGTYRRSKTKDDEFSF